MNALFTSSLRVRMKNTNETAIIPQTIRITLLFINARNNPSCLSPDGLLLDSPKAKDDKKQLETVSSSLTIFCLSIVYKLTRGQR